VRHYERLVRERPSQWLMFEDVWSDAPADASDGAEPLPRVADQGRR
jgi:hypothetical protein